MWSNGSHSPPCNFAMRHHCPHVIDEVTACLVLVWFCEANLLLPWSILYNLAYWNSGPLTQWFSHTRWHYNHMLKCRLLGSLPRVSDSSDPGGGCRIIHLTHCPQVYRHCLPRDQLWELPHNTCPLPSHSFAVCGASLSPTPTPVLLGLFCISVLFISLVSVYFMSS